MPPKEPYNDWTEYRRLILMEIESLNESVNCLEEKTHAQDVRLNTIETKISYTSAIIGFVAGVIPAIIGFFLQRLLGG
jgi:hypothetical protein